MQSVELKVGRTVFAWVSSPGHCHPQCWCAKAGMLSARTVAVMAAMVRDFIGFYPARFAKDRDSRGPENRTPVPTPVFLPGRTRAKDARCAVAPGRKPRDPAASETRGKERPPCPPRSERIRQRR